jgi:hypothetical protein
MFGFATISSRSGGFWQKLNYICVIVFHSIVSMYAYLTITEIQFEANLSLWQDVVQNRLLPRLSQSWRPLVFYY